MKVVKKYSEKYTVIDNQMINDKRLSWKARGLFLFLWSRPSDWDFYETEVENHSTKDGRASLRSGIKELEKYGYISRKRIRNAKGQVSTSYWELCDKPTLDNPTLDKPTQDNRTLLSTNELSTNKKNTKKEPRKRIYEESSQEYLLADKLYHKILSYGVKVKEPDLQDWSDTFRLMIERDKISEDKISDMIDWVSEHKFWKTTVLSPTKLREKYPTLRLQANEDYLSKKGKGKINKVDDLWED